jgi:hypothetical protein
MHMHVIRSNEPQRRKEALREQGGNFDAVHRNECACCDGVMTSHEATGEDCVDSEEVGQRKTAVARDGAIRAVAPPQLTSIPPDQRTSESHDYTRLAVLKLLNASFDEPHSALKESGRKPVELSQSFLPRCVETHD